jgi:glutathione S-transferase
MKLFGSVTSPFVRRVRMLLADRDYELVPVNVYEPAGQQLLAQYSPVGRLPVLVDGDEVIWDSALICEYLNGEPEPLPSKKLLVLINEANDAGVTLFQFQKFGMGIDSTYAHNCQRRLRQILGYLNDYLLSNPAFAEAWQTPQISVYAMLDWLAFREVIEWRASYPQLLAFVERHQQRPEVLATDPRQG